MKTNFDFWDHSSPSILRFQCHPASMPLISISMRLWRTLKCSSDTACRLMIGGMMCPDILWLTNMVHAWEISQFICMIQKQKIFGRVGLGYFLIEVPKSNPQQYLSWWKKNYYPIAFQVRMWETLEYFARAKHIKIPHGWDTWLNMVGWLWIFSGMNTQIH